MQVNCDETNLGCNENVMDDNSNGDLHSSGEMDSGDETIGDVCLDKGDDRDRSIVLEWGPVPPMARRKS
ncbi:hypothetical protein Tco_0692806 [Tanacetum coccineum]